jgi:hypothetical protein
MGFAAICGSHSSMILLSRSYVWPANSMPDNTDRDFARDVLNASLTLMSILVAVITFLAVEYRGVRSAPAVMAGLG